MADIGDVCNALTSIAGLALYPSGVSAGSPLGVNFRIYRGHPGPDKLDADMQAGYTQSGTGWTLTNYAGQIVHVCINPRNGLGRLVRPYAISGAQHQAIPPVTLSTSVSGTSVLISGTISAGQGIAVSANGIAAGATAGSADTIATLAATVAADLTAAGISASASGNAIAVPSATTLSANTFVQVATGQEIERQIQNFEITVYVSSRALRDAVSAALKPVFAQNMRFTLPDGFQALMRSAAPIEMDDDRPEKALLFIRKLFFQVEYATVVTGTAATLALTQNTLTAGRGPALTALVET
jgi:hypothetical protein